MKAIKSNTRIAFAYQDTASEVAKSNSRVNPSSGGYYIRVVQPARQVARSSVYDPQGDTGIEHFGADKLITAVCTGLTQQYNTLSESGSDEIIGATQLTDTVYTSQTSIAGECYIVDIKLNTVVDGQDWSVALAAGSGTTVRLELYFESGVVEHMTLRLRLESDLLLNINPSELRLEGNINAFPKAGLSGSMFHAFQTAKTYRDISTRTSAQPEYYSIGGGFDYSIFTAPFGLIRTSIPDTFAPGDTSLASASWIPNSDFANQGAFTTSYSSTLSWFTGKSDMTKRFMAGTASNIEVNSELSDQPVNLGSLFKFKTTHRLFINSNSTPNSSMWVGTSNDLSWGQKYGWHSNFLNVDLVPVNTDKTPLNAPVHNGDDGDMLFGVPMPLHRQTSSNPLAFTSRISDPNYLNYEQYKASGYAYNTVLEGFGSGNYSNPWNATMHGAYPNIGVLFGSAGAYPSYQIGQINGPQNAVFRNLCLEMGEATLVLEQQTLRGDGVLLDEQSLGNFQAFPNSNGGIGNAGMYLTDIDREQVKKHYALLPTAQDTLTNLALTGSVQNVTLNNGRNFFHASHAGDGDRVLEPIFHGVIRFAHIFRFGTSDLSVTDISAVPAAISAFGIEAGQQFGNMLDLKGVFYGCYGSTSAQSKRFNGVDLMFNLIYNTSGIPRTWKYGANGDSPGQTEVGFNAFIKSAADLSLSTSWDGSHNIASLIDSGYGDKVQGLGSAFELRAQDISYINTVNVTDSLNLDSTSSSSPIGSPFNAIPSNYGAAGSSSKETDRANNAVVSEDSYQVSAVPTATSDAFGETTGAIVPQYPIALRQATALDNFGGIIGQTTTARSIIYGKSLEDDTIDVPGFYQGGEYRGYTSTFGLVFPNPTPHQEHQYVVSSGPDKCFKIIDSSVSVGAATAGTGFGAPGISQKIVYSMKFTHTCATDFKTNSDEITVTGGSLAQRVASVLEIFPTIELRTLSSYAPNSANVYEDVNPLGLAYKIVVTDENDVDDINIINEGDPDTYLLTITFTQDANDVYNNPDDDISEDIVIGNTQFWTDLPLAPNNGFPASAENTMSPRYGSYAGHQDYNYHKASFITVSTVSNWETTELPSGGYPEVDMPDHGIILTGDSNVIYHHPFLTFGENDNEGINETIDESTTVLGCTDPDAVNYNADATDDDGSCLLCEDQANNQGWNLGVDGLSGGQGSFLRAGVSGSSPNYLYGEVGGTTSQSDIGWTATGLTTPFFSSAGKYGGAIVTDNNVIGEVAEGYEFSIATQVSSGTTGYNTMINALQQYIGDDITSWNLRIIPWSDAVGDIGIDFEGSYSVDNPAPPEIADLGAVFSGPPSSGTIASPVWDWSVLQNVPLGAGVPYLLELQLAPKALPVGCDTYTSGDAKIYSIMWTSFCGCHQVSNDYFFTGLGGNGWPWNTTQAFPILNYNGTGFSCPDVPAELVGDNDYPLSVCYQADEQATTCDGFFLYCVASQTPDCNTNINLINDLSVDAYQEGSQYFFDYVNYSIIVQIEGFYDPNGDQFVGISLNNIPDFVVTVEGPDGYFQEHNQETATFVNAGVGGAGLMTMEFDLMTAPGDYTVSYSFPGTAGTGPYPDSLIDAPCSYEEVVTVVPPSDDQAGCPELIPGCTDNTADNYDANANFDDGTCIFPDPCSEVFNNSNLPVEATATNAGSTCVQQAVVVNGVEYTANVIVPSLTGSITAEVNYDVPSTGLEDGVIAPSFAFLIFPTSTSTAQLGFDTIISQTSAIFGSEFYPTSTVTGITSTSQVTGELLFAYSPLFEIAGVDATFTHTFTSLAPNTYYVLAVPNLGAANLNECTDAPVIKVEDFLFQITVGMNPPDEDCPEPCLTGDCEDAVPGCTDPSAENYEPTATINNGSCTYPQTFCEENPDHELCVDCDDAIAQGLPRLSSGKLDNSICDPVNGSDGECTDPNACNYNPDAPLELSNNQLCDYCSCVGEDGDCDDDNDCETDVSPDCTEPEPECPDPGNPNCNPTIYDPCPTGECPPPLDPCYILGNCDPDDDNPPVIEDPFVWEEPIVELECVPQVAGTDSEQAYFDNVIQTAFQCMSDEGKKMLFKMSVGVDYDEEDLMKLSMVAYLLNGGADHSTLTCIFNCNYDSEQKSQELDCRSEWIKSGARFWNSTDTFARGTTVMHFIQENGIVTQNLYVAQNNIQPGGLLPQFMNSGWHRCTSVRVRTTDTNNIATGTEQYLQVFWEYITRFCSSCEVGTKPAAPEEQNVVDPKIFKDYLDPKPSNNDTGTGSGILGEDGDEIIF